VVDALCHIHGVVARNLAFFISQINNILSCNPNFIVKFIKRQANMVAHIVARATISRFRRCTFETLSIFISTLLIKKMIYFMFVKKKNQIL
jgi:hypothetical protein